MADVPVIVVSSPKPQSGNSVLALNLAGALWNDGYKVGLFSSRPSEITDFLNKRAKLIKETKAKIAKPILIQSLNNSADVSALVADIGAADYVLHEDVFSAAQTIITPLNYKDDVIWQANDKYLKFIWEVKKKQAARGIKYLNWIVVPYLKEKHSDFTAEIESKAKLFGFKIAPAIYYRDEYMHVLNGYCAADLINKKLEKMMNLNDVYARREILKLTDFIWQK